MTAGFRSPAGIWVGGASAPVRQLGYRSPFAFWAGGAGAFVEAVHPPMGGRVSFARVRHTDIDRRRRAHDDLLLLLAAQFSKRIQ